MAYPIHASCQCGGVSYKLLAAPTMVVACHCKACQTLSTNAFSVTAMVKSNTIEFSGEMKEWSRPADSGNVSVAKFCPTCGNCIYHINPKEPEVIKLKLKSNEASNSTVLQPTTHVWVSEKQDWYTIPDDVKVFEKQS